MNRQVGVDSKCTGTVVADPLNTGHVTGAYAVSCLALAHCTLIGR